MYVPPQEPEYQFQFAPVPKLPPVEVRVVDEPWHKVEGDAETEEGGNERRLTIIVTLAHEVVLKGPSALTQYEELTVGVWFTEIPVPINVPPQEPEYQHHLASYPRKPPVKLNVTESPRHAEDGVV